MTSGPMLAMVCEGLKTGRVMLGATNPADSGSVTITSEVISASRLVATFATALTLLSLPTRRLLCNGELSEGVGLRVDSHHPAQARHQQPSHKLVYPQHNQ